MNRAAEARCSRLPRWSSDAAGNLVALANGWRAGAGLTISFAAGDIDLSGLPGGLQRARTTIGAKHFDLPVSDGSSGSGAPPPVSAAGPITPRQVSFVVHPERQSGIHTLTDRIEGTALVDLGACTVELLTVRRYHATRDGSLGDAVEITGDALAELLAEVDLEDAAFIAAEKAVST